jgi:ADP-heptose:LPS heptosyltransferase
MLSKYKFTFILMRIPALQKLLNIAVYPLFYLVRILNRIGNEEGKSIIIVSLHRLGDTVFTIPAVKEIIKHYNKDVHIVCYENNALIYKEALTDLNYVILSKNDFYLNGRIAKGKTRRLIKKLKPKIIFDLTESVKSAFLIFALPAKELIGSNEEHFKSIYTHFAPIRKTPHLIDTYLDVVKTKFEIENENRIKAFKINFNRKGKILIHPFGGWAAKEWELDKFILLSEKLSLEYNVEILTPINSLGYNEKQEAEKRKITITETNSITDLIEKIKECSVFIGNDSGLLQFMVRRIPIILFRTVMLMILLLKQYTVHRKKINNIVLQMLVWLVVLHLSVWNYWV